VTKAVRSLHDAIKPPSSLRDNPCAACAVRELSVCGALEEAELDRLNSLVSQFEVKAGRTVFFETDPAEFLFVIIEGCIKLYKLMADGRRQITGFLYPSDFLGLAMQERYAYTAEAVGQTRLCRFERAKLEALLEQYPRLEKRLLGIASNELASAQDQMLLLGRKTADEKIATFLYMLSRRAYLKQQPVDELALPMSRSDIADHLGLTTETVSRCFTRLRKRSLIAFDDPHAVKIIDWSGFAELAGAAEGLEPNTGL